MFSLFVSTESGTLMRKKTVIKQSTVIHSQSVQIRLVRARTQKQMAECKQRNSCLLWRVFTRSNLIGLCNKGNLLYANRQMYAILSDFKIIIILILNAKKKKFEAQKNKYAFWYIFRGFNFFFFFFFFFLRL